MRYLNVPFPEKDQAKALGARWDAIARRWYIPQALLNEEEKFSQWFIEQNQPIIGTSSEPVQQNESLLSDAKPVSNHRNENNKTNSGNLKPNAISLSQVLLRVSDALRNQLPNAVWVIAEVANIQQRNGHFYLELTETTHQGQMLAKCRAMIWSRNAKIIIKSFQEQTGKAISSGQKLLLLATVTFHTQYGFSLQIEDIDANYTLGELEQNLAALRQQLKIEKRLEKNKSFPIPKDFFHIAVIAPPKAAGLGDFQADAIKLERNALCVFDYFYAAFQGDSVKSEIPDALRKINQLQQKAVQGQDQIKAYDAVVIIRGGGAKLDLHHLNEYQIAYALSEMTLPVITGIGHEKDNCILDEMAAVRCDTPSKAIDFIRRQITGEAQKAKQGWMQIQQLAHIAVKQEVQSLSEIKYQMQKGARERLYQFQSQLEPLSNKITTTARSKIQSQYSQLELQKQSIKSHITQHLGNLQRNCDHYHQQLLKDSAKYLSTTRQEIKQTIQLILNAGPQTQLSRGFVVTKDENGNVLTTAAKAKAEERLELSYQDGNFWVKPIQE